MTTDNTNDTNTMINTKINKANTANITSNSNDNTHNNNEIDDIKLEDILKECDNAPASTTTKTQPPPRRTTLPPPPLLRLMDDFYEQQNKPKSWFSKLFPFLDSNRHQSSYEAAAGRHGPIIKHGVGTQSGRKSVPWYVIGPVLAFTATMFAYPFIYTRHYVSPTDPHLVAATQSSSRAQASSRSQHATPAPIPGSDSKAIRGAYLNAGSREVPEDAIHIGIYKK
jgi:hypothetical protein